MNTQAGVADHFTQHIELGTGNERQVDSGARDDAIGAPVLRVLAAETAKEKQSTQVFDTESCDSEDQERDIIPVEDVDSASYYWDASTMAPLSRASAAALARLRAFKPPPFPLWDRLPLSRRAAVLLLLYADRRGDLRVVITMRAATLRSFSGHAALPGGKADTLEETPYQIARREAWEEIGLPMDDHKIPPPFRIEHLGYLPAHLARTEIVVRPCIAFLHAGADDAPVPTVEDSLIPRLDAKEVAAVFSAPFHNFLRAEDEPAPPLLPLPRQDVQQALPPGKWYEGSWTHWHDKPWRMHFFYVPVNNQRVTKPKTRDGGLASLADEGPEDGDMPGRYKVWGMTARILVDGATVAYGEQPEFEHNSHFGDEARIEGLAKLNLLGDKKRAGGGFSEEDLRRTKKATKM